MNAAIRANRQAWDIAVRASARDKLVSSMLTSPVTLAESQTRRRVVSSASGEH